MICWMPLPLHAMVVIINGLHAEKETGATCTGLDAMLRASARKGSWMFLEPVDALTTNQPPEHSFNSTERGVITQERGKREQDAAA